MNEQVGIDPPYGGSCPACGGSDVRVRAFKTPWKSGETGVTYCIDCAYGFTVPHQHPIDMYGDAACRAHREAKKDTGAGGQQERA
jgi:hypothetical protein